MSNIQRGDTAAAVAELDAISPNATGDGDPEGMHSAADEVLWAYVPQEVQEAYDRVVDRAGAWWYA